VNRWGEISFVLVLSLGAAACNAMVGHVNGPAAPLAPSITSQPVNQTVISGQTSTFNVVATGTAPLNYQWQKNGTNITGAASASYTTPATGTSDSGSTFDVVVSNAAGAATSNPATLTVNAAAVAPTISTQPVNQSVTAGQTATFTVVATGTAPLNYQWQKNGRNITGAASASYTTPATSTSDSGSTFDVVVNNAAGAATSNPATLTVNAAAVAPTISTQPVNQSVTAGQTATFSVAAAGTAPLNYQWNKNGTAINGATSASYTTPATTASDNGSLFTVVVSNASGSVTSNAATLTVNAASPTLQITTTQLPGATVSAAFNATLTAAGGTTPYSWSLGSGSLPNGLALSSSGSISGTPTSAGSFPFTVQVTDATAHTASSNLSITVANSNGSTASDCTLFASPSGNDSNSGASVSAPKTFSGAANATSPGSVVCLLGGTYNFSSSFTPPSSGTPSSWITYKSYGDSPVNIVYTGPADASPLFRLGSGSFPSGGVSYIEFRGLNLNGHGNSGDAFWCQGTHHLRFINNSMSDTGTAGIGTRDCDYLTADHNLINHNGYLPASTSTPQWYGWTSGISYNSNQWFDNYSGFHNIIANNIVVGEFDSSTNHTDGNGIILDLSNGSYNASTANTPPVLIINNVVYGNGGRCIHAYIVTNFYIVNNTCYDNNLDPTLGTAGSFSTNGSQNGYFINNISVAWSSLYPTYIQEGTNSNIQYFADLYFGSSPNFSNSQLFQADPLFVNPPSLTQYGYFSALPPLQLGNDLILQPGSPAYGKGIDPSTLSGLPSAILSDLKNYIYTDINGKARPLGGGSDPGAYQH